MHIRGKITGQRGVGGAVGVHEATGGDGGEGGSAPHGLLSGDPLYISGSGGSQQGDVADC